MATVRDNATRVKRFRGQKATLRTDRTRLLVGLDIAQAEHAVHLRHAHTRVVVPTLTIPNTTRGFTELWARFQQAQRTTGCREVVCGLEPTGSTTEGVATFLETQGADVVLLLQQRGLLEPADPGWDLVQARREGRRQLRRSAGAGQGALLPRSHRPAGGTPAPREVSAPGADRTRGRQGPLADHPAPRPGADGGRAASAPVGRAAGRAPGLGAGRPRVAGSAEGASAARPGHRLCGSRGPSDGHTGPHRDPRSGAHPARRTASGLHPPPHDSWVGPTVGAILLAEIGDIGWFTQFSQLRPLAGLDIVRVQSGQFAGQFRISKCGRELLRWALDHAAVGLARTAAGPARLAALKTKRRGDRYAGFKAVTELAAKQLRVAWGVGGAGPRTRPRGRPGSGASPAEAAARRSATSSPGSGQRETCNVAAPQRDRGGTLARRSALTSPD